jgi:Fe-S-cluster containining protein
LTTTEIKLSKALEKGIHFSCMMCGTCCRGLDEGEVYLYNEDIKRLANHLNFKGFEGLREFAKRYLKIIDDSFLWKEIGGERKKIYRFKTLAFKFIGNDDHCPFLKDNKCSVHEARPFQCRCFPFWQMMISSNSNFINYSKKCLGLRQLKGNFYSKENILEWAMAEHKLEMNYFLKMKTNGFNILKVYPFLPDELLENEEDEIINI